jgi:hypothetical protein
MPNLKFRRLAIYRVHLSVDGNRADSGDVQLELLVTSRSKTAAGRKAARVAWKKMGYIFSEIHVVSSEKATLWQ